MTVSSQPNADPSAIVSDIRAALTQVLSSDEFSASERLTEFLTYIVEEALQGREDQIRAKTIAEAVYGRDASDEMAANVVRVDAGRLRQRLEAYYQGAGADDPVRINVKKGGYAPNFSRVTTNAAQSGAPERVRPGIALMLGSAVIIAGGLTGAILMVDETSEAPPSTAATNSTNQASAERRAVFERAPADLQADKLVEQARELMFPSFDRVRLDAAQTLFDDVIERDAAHTQALAGSAQNQAMIAFLFSPDDAREQKLTQAMELANRAIESDPKSAWAYSALAWTQFVSGDEAGAMRAAERARSLAPESGAIQDYDALIYFFGGRFEDAIRVSDPAKEGLPYGDRSPRRNLLGAALFHKGEFDAAAAAFESSAESGLPVSAPAFAYFVASVEAAGDHARAETLAQELMTTWPDRRIDLMVGKLLRDQDAVSEFLTQLNAAGWRPASELAN